MNERYYFVERITLDEPMDLHQAQDYAKAQARKYPSMQFHVLKSVGHTTQEVGWEWHNEQANKDMIPADFYQGLDDLKHGRMVDMETAMNETPPKRIKLPQSIKEAECMLLVAESYLKTNKPERITNDTQQYRMLQEGE